MTAPVPPMPRRHYIHDSRGYWCASCGERLELKPGSASEVRPCPMTHGGEKS